MFQMYKVGYLPPNVDELPPQKSSLQTLFDDSEKKPTVFHILDTDFGTGHTAELFLTHYPHAQVYSVYPTPNPTSNTALKYLQHKFPNRLKTINSPVVQAVQGLRASYPNLQFDIVFVNFSATQNITESDLRHLLVSCKHVVSPTANRVVLNNTLSKLEWLTGSNITPNKVWKQAQEWGVVREIKAQDYAKGRGMSWGCMQV